MKTNHYLSAALLLLLGAASCTNDDSVDYASDPSAVRIAASVGANSIFSRSTPTGDDAEAQAVFSTGDVIAIATDDQTVVNYIKGEGDTWAPAVSTSFLRWTADAMTFKAYYPVVDGASMTTFTVPTDQTTVAKITSADYMTFSGSKSKPATAGEGINIEMQRQMARVILNISFKNQFTGEETLSNVTIASPADLTKAATARIQPYSPVAKNYVAVVIPGMESGTADFVTLTVGTTSLTAKLTKTIEAGKSYTFALTVGKDLLAVESVTVDDWTNTATIPGGEAVWDGITYIAYTTNNGQALTPNTSIYDFGASYYPDKSTYADGQGKLAFFGTVTAIAKEAFLDRGALTSIIIPEGVTEIGERAFESCYSLTSISIPEGVTRIRKDAFRKCTSLTNITLPESLIEIEEKAFYNCTSLKSIHIPAGLTKINEQAFYGCESLESLTAAAENSVYNSPENSNAIIEKETNTLVLGCKNTIIPNNVTSIGNYAFIGRLGLESISLPASVTAIGNYAFSQCYDMSTINFSEGLKSIGASAFAYTALTRIFLPNSLETIGDQAFYLCSDLISIRIRENVTSIGAQTFYNSYKLQYIYCYAPNPPALGEDAFKDTNYSYLKILVPAASLETYKAALDWSAHSAKMTIVEEE